MGISTYLKKVVKHEISVDNSRSHFLELLEFEYRGNIEQLEDRLAHTVTHNKFERDLKSYLQSCMMLRRGNYNQLIQNYNDRKIEHIVILMSVRINIILARIFVGDYTTAQAHTLRFQREINDHDLEIHNLTIEWINGLINHDLGNFTTAIGYYRNILDSLPSSHEDLRANILIDYGDVETHLGNYDRSQDYLTEAIDIYRTIGDDQNLGRALYIYAIHLYFKAEPQKALKVAKDALDIHMRYSNPTHIGRSKYVIGELFYGTGDFKHAKEYLKEAQKLFDEIGNTRDMSYPHILLATIKSNENDLQEAISHINTSINFLSEIDHELDLSSCYQVKGEILVKNGRPKEGLKYLLKSLKLKQKFGNDTLTSIALFQVVLTLKRLQDDGRASQYLQEFRNLENASDIEYVSHLYHAIKAYDLKTRDRLRDKVKAMEIFEDLSQADNIEYEYKVFVLLNLVELLLDELKLFSSEQIIQKIMSHLSAITELARYNNDTVLQLEVELVRSRFLIIEGEIETADKHLLWLEEETKNLDAHNLHQQVIEERKKFEKEIDSWVNSIKQGSDLYNLVKESQVQDYLKRISENFKKDNL